MSGLHPDWFALGLILAAGATIAAVVLLLAWIGGLQ